MKLQLILINFLFAFSLLAQGEFNNWYFGNGAGLSFDSGDPVSVSNNVMTTSEACASISNEDGELLFFTNGNTVWDANQNQMPNGFDLLGNFSSQCIIIPKPENPDRYFIVSTDAVFVSNSSGMVYSEIDMSLNGGMGDVVNGMKNISLFPESGEWITAVPHENCTDIWIIGHGNANDPNLKAFQVTSDGISSTPVTSDIGITYEGQDKGLGIVKPNESGDLLILTKPLFQSTITKIDFNRATGSANGSILHQGSQNKGMGVEFSPDGTKLYIGTFGQAKIYQFDLTASDIGASRVEIGDLTPQGEIGYIQLAPNGKIYVNYNIFSSATNFLGAINNPNALGTSCNFVQNAVSLGSANTINGLPWHYNHNNEDIVDELDLGNDTIICPGEELALDGFVESELPVNYTWSNGISEPNTSINEQGLYWLERQIGNCPSKRDSILVLIDSTEIDVALKDTVSCLAINYHYELNSTHSLNSIEWNMGDGMTYTDFSGFHQYSTPGSYYLSLTATSSNNCFFEIDSLVEVVVFPKPVANFTWNPVHPKINENITVSDVSYSDITNVTWFQGEHTVATSSSYEFEPTSYDEVWLGLKVENEQGCSDSIVKIISINGDPLVYVPNSFTPNNDGTNDELKIVDINNFLDDFSIYDRWGNIIWTTNSSNNYWDGTFNGKNVPDGLYVYKLLISKDGVSAREITGHISVLR